MNIISSIIGFILGAITMLFLIKKFVFDFDSSNCSGKCPEFKKKEK